jgi:hypothetical protein
MTARNKRSFGVVPCVAETVKADLRTQILGGDDGGDELVEAALESMPIG